MSFCGTIRERDRWKFIGLSGTCSSLVSQLLHLKYADKIKEAPGSQLRLFKLDKDAREQFSKFARNLRWFATDHNVHNEVYWKAYCEHEYNDYDFYCFFQQWSRKELSKIADALEKIGKGEELTDYDETIEALNTMNHRADIKADRGGCF